MNHFGLAAERSDTANLKSHSIRLLCDSVSFSSWKQRSSYGQFTEFYLDTSDEVISVSECSNICFCGDHNTSLFSQATSNDLMCGRTILGIACNTIQRNKQAKV